MPAKQATSESDGFSAAERAAMKERAAELRAEGKKGAKKADGLQAVLDAIAKMGRRGPRPRRAGPRRGDVDRTGPVPKTWYGMPAYANADDKVVLFFQDSGKFSYRYSTLGFQDTAHLDDGDLWPVAYALVEWTPAVEKRVVSPREGRRLLTLAPSRPAATLLSMWSLWSENSVLSDLLPGLGAVDRVARRRSPRSGASGPSPRPGRSGRRCRPPRSLSYQSSGSALSHQSSGSVLSSQASRALRGRRTARGRCRPGSSARACCGAGSRRRPPRPTSPRPLVAPGSPPGGRWSSAEPARGLGEVVTPVMLAAPGALCRIYRGHASRRRASRGVHQAPPVPCHDAGLPP